MWQGTRAQITRAARLARAACREADEPFHADALAAALGISYDELVAAANDESRPAVAARLRAVIQECTASVVAEALRADPKAHGLWMFYLRNRVGFADGRAASAGQAVTFIGEDRIE